MAAEINGKSFEKKVKKIDEGIDKFKGLDEMIKEKKELKL